MDVLDVSLLRLGYPGGGGVRIPMSPVMLAVRPSIKYKVYNVRQYDWRNG